METTMLITGYDSLALINFKRGKHHMNEVYSRIMGEPVNVTTRKERLECWRKAIEERKRLGIDAKDYSKLLGIHFATYDYWVREVELERKRAEVKEKEAERIKLEFAKKEQAAESNPIFIEINGARIKVEPNQDLDLLSKICNILNSVNKNNTGENQYA